MNKSMLLTGAALLLAATAGAEPAKEAPKPAEATEIKCAVRTDNPVSIQKATEKKLYADYNGNRYFFCCGGCPKAFSKDPEKYAKNDHIAIPKEAAAPAAPAEEKPGG